METSLRELLDHSKFHQGAVREVAALLPDADEALAALLDETSTGTDTDQLGFLLILLAALDAGRAVDAAHLAHGAAMCLDAQRLGCFVWKMTGDVPAALMAALVRGGFPHHLHAGILFVLMAWCERHRGGELPEGFAADARRLARNKALDKDALMPLAAVAARSRDEALQAVVRQHHPATLTPHAAAAAVTYGDALITLFDAPVMTLLPAAPPRGGAYRQPIRRAVEKISRNDPCPCGSGKKYKRCCFDQDRERLTLSSEVAGKTQAELRVAPTTDLTEGRLKGMHAHELARLDPGKVPAGLRNMFLLHCCALGVFERAAETLEVTAFDGDEDYHGAWNCVMFFAMRAQRRDVAERVAAARVARQPGFALPLRYRLLVAQGDDAEETRVLAEYTLALLRETDEEKIEEFLHGLLHSRFPALGILVTRGFIVTLEHKKAGTLLERLLETRDKLELPPDDPFSDLLERRLAEETSDEGADAAKLREARQRLDAKAAEVRALKEEIDHQRRRLDRQERAQREKEKVVAPVSSPAPAAAADDAALREMRGKLARLKGTLGERAAERTALRQELERARDALETLRAGPAAAPAPTPEGAGEDEAALYVPASVEGNQPLRLVEYPARFRETLEALPRAAARAALGLLGRLAGGEPAAFVGVVQLKACHGVLRQRVGSEHRLLFRLGSDRVQVVDFINRRDLDRTIKRLRAAG